MSEGVINLIMDGLVLLFLGATIFYAARLSIHLRNFREGRKDLEKLIGDLSRQIDKAEGSIDTLKTAARDVARNLQQQMDEAKSIGAELDIMVRGANNTADRLDKSADRHRTAEPSFPLPKSQRGKARDREEFSGFSIRDPEAGRDEADFIPDVMDMSDNESGSVAERELLEALQIRKNR